jgi:hypothetical protein
MMSDDFDSGPLWDLLGRARPVGVSPYFVRRVLREIRRTPARPLLPPIFVRWLAAGALAILAVGFFLTLPPAPASADIAGFDAITGIDSLAIVEEFRMSQDD